MTLRSFIRNNRKELDEYIATSLDCHVSEIPYKNDEERRLWILNDEGMYLWARSEGVKI